MTPFKKKLRNRTKSVFTYLQVNMEQQYGLLSITQQYIKVKDSMKDVSQDICLI